jgi:hypothetical protein
MVQHVFERRFDRNPILFVDVRVEASTNNVDFHRAAGDGRLKAGRDEFCGAHLSIIPPFPFAGCETV